MITTNNLVFGGGYANGAKVTTAGTPKADGHIDRKYPSFAKKIREQINWMNVNETDIQAIVSSLTSKTMGISINTQVESPNDKFNEEAEALIAEHGNFGLENGNIVALGEITGKHHFNACGRIISDFTALNGGIILRHHYNTAWTIPYKYEFLGVDMIDISKTTYVTEEKPAETTINGLVRNKYGQITDVWIYSTPEKTRSNKVSYSDLTYYSEVWINIDQQTAVSKLTNTLSKLDMTTQYGIAELESAIEEAKAGHYVKSTAYNELMRVVADEINKATTGTGADRIKNAKDLVTPILRDMSNLGLKGRGLTPIASDDEVQFNATKRESAYKDMNNNSEMKISASQGLSDIGVYSKASDANYSSIKYTVETDQRTADIRFDDISNKVFFEINTRLIRVGIQIGRITDRVNYWKNPNKFNKFRYLRRNRIDTEPAKNAVANKTNIAEGLRTRGQIIEESTGVKYETFLKKKHEQDLLALDYEIELEKQRQDKMKKSGITVAEDATAEMLSSIHSQNKQLMTLKEQVAF